MSGIEYAAITPDKYPCVIRHLRNNFFVDEPLNKSLKLSKPGEPHPELEDFSLNILIQGISFMATDCDTGEVAGVVLNGASCQDGPKKDYKDQKLIKIFSFFENVEKDVPDLNKFNIEDILEVKILSVDSKFRKKGIAKSLYNLTEEHAKDRGYKIMRTDATSVFSQRVFLGLGFQVLKEVIYDEYPSKEAPTFRVDPPHVSYKLLIKVLD